MLDSLNEKPKLLLHVCCIGCGAYVGDFLKSDYDVVLYFYNPNIFPGDEHEKRLEETRRVAKKFEFELFEENYDHDAWLKKIAGHEQDQERGERCRICYRDRLQITAHKAKAGGFDYFTTTLTISPYKDSQAIINLGRELDQEKFLAIDFKKKSGFKRAGELAKKHNLYRQDYCGCIYSQVERERKVEFI